jgi:hypothetical protein
VAEREREAAATAATAAAFDTGLAHMDATFRKAGAAITLASQLGSSMVEIKVCAPF